MLPELPTIVPVEVMGLDPAPSAVVAAAAEASAEAEEEEAAASEVVVGDHEVATAEAVTIATRRDTSPGSAQRGTEGSNAEDTRTSHLRNRLWKKRYSEQKNIKKLPKKEKK